MNVPKAVKQSSSKWRIQLRIKGKSYSVVAATEKECVQKAQVLKARLLAGDSLEPDVLRTITLADAFQNYMDENSNTLSPSTLRSYKLCKENHFQDAMSKPLTAKHNWQRMINDEAKECAPKTVINNWGMVSRVLRVNHIAVPDVNLPMRAKNEHPWLDFNQIRIFINAIKGEPWELSALLALNGLRRSELLALTRDSFDIENQTVTVQGAVVEGVDGIVKKDTNKTISSQRIVPLLIPGIMPLLESDCSILYYKGMDTLRKSINTVCLRNGLPEIGVHGLRHSFASFAFHAGIPLTVVQKWGGWSDDRTLKKIYLHVASDDLKKFEEKMRCSFNESTSPVESGDVVNDSQ